MTASADQPPVPAIPESKPNPFERITGVFFSPGPTFESIARRPDVLVPLAIFLVVSLLTGIMMARTIDFTALARESMAANPDAVKNIPPERLERMEKMSGTFMRSMAYASPLITLVILSITAGVLLIGVRMFGGEGDFKQAVSVTTYAWYPRLLQGILAFIVLMNRKSISLFDLQSPLRSSLAFLFDPKTQPLAFALANRFDLFLIWSTILMIFGFSSVSRLSKGKTAAIVISVWVLVTLLTLIGPAIQAARMGS